MALHLSLEHVKTKGDSIQELSLKRSVNRYSNTVEPRLTCSNFNTQNTYQRKILYHIEVLIQGTKFLFSWTCTLRPGSNVKLHMCRI